RSQSVRRVNGFVLVTVVAGLARVEHVLPTDVPLAELIPDLLKRVDLLDAEHVQEAYGIETATGRSLASDLTLRHQGAVDRTVRPLVPAMSVDHSTRYDGVLPPPARPRRSVMGAVRGLRRRPATTRPG